MKKLSVYMLVCILCLCIIGFSNSVSANGDVSVDVGQLTLISQLPKGPKPDDTDHFIHYKYWIYIHGLDNNEYYKIIATLTSSSYFGTMANYGDQTDEDLKFNSLDYGSDITQIPGWTYESISSLSAKRGSDPNDRSLPTHVVVRCHDWAASGNLKIIVYKKDPTTGAYSIKVGEDDINIPDDINDNGICDAWEMDHSETHTENGFIKGGYDPSADDESFSGNNNNGDGWSVNDEYRGLWAEGGHTRLNPKGKDVMLTFDLSVTEKRYSLPYHSFTQIPWGYVLNASTAVHEDDQIRFKPDSQISDDVGWVNYKSTGLLGFKRVWAIRIVNYMSHPSDSDLQGSTYPGPPGKMSKIIMYETTTNSLVIGVYDNLIDKHKNDRSPFTSTQAQKNQGVSDVKENILSHEIGHSLDLDHTSDKKDIMYEFLEFKVHKRKKTVVFPKSIFNRSQRFKDKNHLSDWKATGSATGSTPSPMRSHPVSFYVLTDDDNADSTVEPDYGTPATVPLVPQNLRLTAGNGEVTLAWDAPSSNGGNVITDYEYSYRAGSSGSWSSWTSAGSDLSETVTGLTNGTAYEFRVRAVNGVGDGATATGSDSVTPDPPQYPPGAPTSLSASAGNGQVSLSWSAPSSSGTASISRYDYRYDTNNDGSWASWRSTGSTSTSYTVTGLTNGTLYDFQVRAVSSVGAGPGSNTDTETPRRPIVLPSSPRSLAAEAGDAQVALTWQVPLTTGSGITEYEYRYDTSDDGSWQIWRSTGSTSTSYTVTGLSNNTLYAFEVRARNSDGAGTASNKVTATPLQSITIPGTPSGLSATAGNGQVTLSWSAPLDDGGGIDDYEVRSDTYNDGSWSGWRTTGDTNTSETMTGLTNGTIYAYQIRAVNSAGAGPASNTATATPQVPAGVPDAPTNLTATPGDGQASLSWTAPNDNGSPIIRYEFRSDTYNDGTWSSWASTNRLSTSVTLIQMVNGTLYGFQIRAVNSVGEGAASNTVTVTSQAVTLVSVPDAPTHLTATAGNTSVYLSWRAPVNYGGSTITDFEYRYDTNNNGTWESWTSIGSTYTNYFITGLTNATTYAFQIRAVNSAGAGAASSSATATPATATPTNETSPGPPQYLDADADNGSVTLWWDAPDSDGNTPITDYEYQYRESSGSWSSWTSTGSTSTSYTVGGLTNGTTYEFQVQARNVIGTGTSSGTVSATPNTTVPDSPTGLSTSTGSSTGTIDLSWSAPSNDGGAAITGYEYAYTKYTNGRWGTWTSYSSTGSTSTSYTVSGLESGELYRFRVRAVNSVGSSRSSRVVNTYAR